MGHVVKWAQKAVFQMRDAEAVEASETAKELLAESGIS